MSTAIALRENTELQISINREFAQTGIAARNMLEHAINCGNLLLQAKDQAPHGTWSAWVGANFDGSEWVARKYMQLARAHENGGGITDMESIRAAIRSIAAPRHQTVEEPPALDPASPAGRMFDAAKAFSSADPDEDLPVLEGEAVELPPTGVEERRWSTTLKRVDVVRRCMGEAVNPELTSEATAQALQDASTAARQTAVDLEQMAATARRRAA